ncbi:MAG: hypothetical protein ACYCZD_14985 [Rhodanobacter sp.]
MLPREGENPADREQDDPGHSEAGGLFMYYIKSLVGTGHGTGSMAKTRLDGDVNVS